MLKKMLKLLMHSAILCCIMFELSGCGQTGALYLPTKPSTTNDNAKVNTKSA